MQVVGSYEHRIGLVVGMPLPCVKLFIATHESLDCHVSRFHIAGNIARRVLGGGRVEQDGVDLAGDVSFQAAHGLLRDFPFAGEASRQPEDRFEHAAFRLIVARLRQSFS